VIGNYAYETVESLQRCVLILDKMLEKQRENSPESNLLKQQKEEYLQAIWDLWMRMSEGDRGKARAVAILASMHELGYLHYHQNPPRFEDAERILDVLWKARRAKLGSNNVDTMSSLELLLSSRHERGKEFLENKNFKVAVALFNEVEVSRRDTLDRGDSKTVEASNWLKLGNQIARLPRDIGQGTEASLEAVWDKRDQFQYKPVSYKIIS